MARPPKPRLFAVHAQLSLGWQPIHIEAGQTVDYIPPDDIDHLAEEGVITELPVGSRAPDVVLLGTAASDAEPQEE